MNPNSRGANFSEIQSVLNENGIPLSRVSAINVLPDNNFYSRGLRTWDEKTAALNLEYCF
jgi:hypothetical protein